MRTLKLVIEYDGSRYHGWQRQKNGPSIQEVLEAKMAVITGEHPKVIGSGRTDAGVHALGQVAHVRIASSIPLKSLCNGLNSLLPEDIAILGIEETRADFHARIDARSKTYLYRICNRPPALPSCVAKPGPSINPSIGKPWLRRRDICWEPTISVPSAQFTRK
jgi:tRNA pseudouridine38-40 synthase